MLPYQKGGWRKDGRDLIQEWQASRENSTHAFVDTADDLDHLENQKLDYLLGLFASSHMDAELKRESNSTQPSLEKMTRKAINILKNSPDGFFLMVESKFNY